MNLLRKLTKIIAVVFVLFSVQITAQDANWEEQKNEEGITVKTRVVEGSKIKEFKAEMIVDSTPEELLAVLLDFEEYSTWISGCETTAIVKKYNENNYEYYLELYAPWPIANRDVVINASITKELGRILYTMKNAVGKLALKKGIRRMPKFNGFWEFKKLANGGTKVTQQVHAEPGGSIPAWLANSKVTDGPLESFKNLKEKLKK